MSKSNNKKNRTDGVIKSCGKNFPTPMTQDNLVTSAYSLPEDQLIARKTNKNNLL